MTVRLNQIYTESTRASGTKMVLSSDHMHAESSSDSDIGDS